MKPEDASKISRHEHEYRQLTIVFDIPRLRIRRSEGNLLTFLEDCGLILANLNIVNLQI